MKYVQSKNELPEFEKSKNKKKNFFFLPLSFCVCHDGLNIKLQSCNNLILKIFYKAILLSFDFDNPRIISNQYLIRRDNSLEKSKKKKNHQKKESFRFFLPFPKFQ
jgi:hypothetical protein